MAKIKVHELAKELDMQSKDIIAILDALGIEGKKPASGLEDDQVEAVRKKLKAPQVQAAKSEAPAKAEEKKAAESAKPKADTAKTEEKNETPVAPKVRPAGDTVPKKKKPNIIVVSHKSSQQQRGTEAPKNQGNRNDSRGGVSGRPSQGIIRPTVPTTAERAARLAEVNPQGGDKNRLRKNNNSIQKVSGAQDQTGNNTDRIVNGDNNVAAGTAEAKATEVKAEPTATESSQNVEKRPGKTDRFEKNDRNDRGDKSFAPNGGRSDNRPQGDRRNGRNDRSFGDRNERNGNKFSRDGQRGDSRGDSRGDRGARDGQNRGGFKSGIVINQSKNYATSASAPAGKESEKNRAQSDRRNNKERDRKEKSYDNEDGFRGGKPVKGAKVAKLERPQEKKQQPEEEKIKVIVLPDMITIKDLADKMKIQASQIIKKLFMQGQIVTVNQEISYEQAEEIAVEYDILCEHEVVVDVIEELLKEEDEDEATMTKRPPVVCVMGHVDHGKTSLLDAIRNTKVIDKEAGGITQAIGAYVVEINGQKITFLDTPGHEAFTAMRMRGANATDIAILVVAADDGVMPQTIEAINHAKAAGIEIIVAVNKIDKPSANIDRVKQELSEYELVPEDWGGSTVFAPVSAKTGEGIEQLLEMILLTSEILELKANKKRRARGMVIEAQLDKGRGPVATVLVQKGTLKVGDFIAAGACNGKVRAMIDDTGRRVKEAGPSTPVEILGLNDVPGAGEIFLSLDSDKEAKHFAETFISQNKAKLLEDTKAKMSLDDLFSQIQAGNLKELNLIIKADVQGSVEAVKESLVKLSNEEVVVKIIHSGVGAINESDVILASASKAIIIGFNVRPDAMAKNVAETEGVDVRLYDVIYKAIEDVEAAMKGMLDPIFEEKVIGHAEIRQIFKASGIGNIAGSYVMDGIMQRGAMIRISRQGEQIHEGKLASLKRFKDDAKEVKQGFECGLVFENFHEFEELDIVEAYVMVEVPRT